MCALSESSKNGDISFGSRFAMHGKVVEVCGAATSGKTQLLLTTVAAAAVDDPHLSAVFVCCTAVQSTISRLRSLVVAFVRKKVDDALLSRGRLGSALPRAVAFRKHEMIDDIDAALRADLAHSMTVEGEAVLRQVLVVHIVEAGPLLIFLQNMVHGLNTGRESEDRVSKEMTSSLIPRFPEVSTDSCLVDLAAVEADLAASYSHAQIAAATVTSEMHRRENGLGPILLAIDGLGSSLGAALSSQVGYHAGHALLAAVGSALHELARLDVAVLVSNTAVLNREQHTISNSFSIPSMDFKPALGNTWATIPDAVFLVQPVRRDSESTVDGRVKVSVLKMREKVRLSMLFLLCAIKVSAQVLSWCCTPRRVHSLCFHYAAASDDQLPTTAIFLPH